MVIGLPGDNFWLTPAHWGALALANQGGHDGLGLHVAAIAIDQAFVKQHGF